MLLYWRWLLHDGEMYICIPMQKLSLSDLHDF